MADLNPETGLPNELSLGRVLNDLYMAPHEIAALLSSWHAPMRGSPAEAQALADHAAAIVNPVTYDPNLANKPAAAEQKKFVPEKRDYTFFEHSPESEPAPAPTSEPTTPAPDASLTVV